MNKGFQNLAADFPHYRNQDSDFQLFKDTKYSLIENEVQKSLINDRVDKNLKNFQPYDFDALYKIVLIGDSNTGKTSMLVRFADNIFNDNYLCTIGVDFKIKTLKVDNKIIKMQIWDTAGQERFRSISQAYYRNSHGCVAVYDITSRSSFEAIEEQIRNFINYSAQDVSRNIILVGNKTDLDAKRQVTLEEAVDLAKKLKLSAVFETSAKKNDSIDDVFYRSIVNCVDFYNSSGEQPLVNKSGSRSRIFSAQTELNSRGQSFIINKSKYEKQEEFDDCQLESSRYFSNRTMPEREPGEPLQLQSYPQNVKIRKGGQQNGNYRRRRKNSRNNKQGCCLN